MEPFFHFTHLPELDLQYVEQSLFVDYNLPKPELTTPTGRVVWSSSSFKDTKFCKDLEKEFGSISFPIKTNYYRNDPMTMYNWHTDLDRLCSINFLLSDTNEYLTIAETGKKSRLTTGIDLCKYKFLMPTLLNTEIMHCVINYSHHPRYILAVAPGEGSFDDVKQFLLDYRTDNY